MVAARNPLAFIPTYSYSIDVLCGMPVEPPAGPAGRMAEIELFDGSRWFVAVARSGGRPTRKTSADVLSDVASRLAF